jgi:integrase
MPRIQLTDRFIGGAKAKDGPQTDYFDARTPGLALRVTDRGVKTWTLIFTSPKNGKRARMTLGAYPATTLARARGLAIEARGFLDEKRDPRDALAGPDGSMTVAALAQSYVSKHVRPHLRGASETERIIAHIVKLIGLVRLADLHRRDVNRCVDPLIARGSMTSAARTFAKARAMLRWAVARGDLDRSPMEGMKKPEEPAARERVLSDEDIRKIWAAEFGSPYDQIIRLCLVTAQRSGEVAGMRVEEIDLARRVWTIPAARTKNQYQHQVPLSDMAASIIKDAIAVAGSASRLFAAEAGAAISSRNHVAKAVARARTALGIAHWTAHDLRRTAITHMARLGVAPIVLGHVANHRTTTKAGVTLAVYSHYTYDAEKRAALELWADRLAAVVGGRVATVVPVGRRKAAAHD